MEYYQVAARWWSNLIRDINPNHFKFREDSEISRVLMENRLSKALKNPLTEEMITKFETRLSEHIQKWGEHHGVMMLSVGYYTDGSLKFIAEEVGISLDRFPEKVNMWITDKCISVGVGSATPTEIIFPVPLR